jgi:hypothetical protein
MPQLSYLQKTIFSSVGRSSEKWEKREVGQLYTDQFQCFASISETIRHIEPSNIPQERELFSLQTSVLEIILYLNAYSLKSIQDQNSENSNTWILTDVMYHALASIGIRNVFIAIDRAWEMLQITPP